MCTTCVAQGAAYLVPAVAVVKTRSWRRRRRRPDTAAEAQAPDVRHPRHPAEAAAD